MLQHSDGESLLRQRRFDEAIACFQQRLDESPEDLTALLLLGIAHLLKGSREAFVALHRRAAALIDRLGRLEGRCAELWEHSRGLAGRLGVSALVLAGTACSQAGDRDTGAAGPVQQPTQEDPAKPAANGATPQQPAGQTAQEGEPQLPPVSAHRYSGGVYLDLRDEIEPSKPNE
jgi:tetratricopeptide (TPR) repeat protein